MDAPRKSQEIVVGVDGSANGRAALRWSVSHAQGGDTIHLIHAWSVSPAVVEAGLASADDDSKALAFLRHEAARAHELGLAPDVQITTKAVLGDPRVALIDAARGADLLVIGARGRSGIAGLLMGSASTYLTRHAPCPTVVVPWPGVDHPDADESGQVDFDRTEVPDL